MLKKEITYTDYNDKEVTEALYFNLSEAELIELEVSEKEGLQATLKKIVDEEDKKKMWAWFKEIVLSAYGQKTEDGKSFLKNPALKEAFAQTAAFSALMTLLVTDSNFAADFVIGIVPKKVTEGSDIRQRMAEAMSTKGPDEIEAAPKPPSN